MSGVNSKAALPPLLLSRSQLDVYASQGLTQVPWLDVPWEDIDLYGYIPAMAQCGRVQRPPPPPHYIAQSRKGHADSIGIGTVVDGCGIGLPSDPARRVKQLERSIAFMRESHAVVLRSLHLEVDELKTKNRDLVFQLVMKSPLQNAVENEESASEPEISQEAAKKIEKLEREVRKLRSALREALKVNGGLNAQLETMKHSLNFTGKSQSTIDLSTEANQRSATPVGSSPKMDEYTDTLQQIQQLTSASRTRSCKETVSGSGPPIKQAIQTVMEGGRPSKGGGASSDWASTGGPRERNRRHSDFQPHLPRLPLRASQQNPPGSQLYDDTCSFPSRDGGDSLPSLKKPMFPSLQQQGPPQQSQGQGRQSHQGGKEGGNPKSRKSRGSHRGRSSMSNSGNHHNHQPQH